MTVLKIRQITKLIIQQVIQLLITQQQTTLTIQVKLQIIQILKQAQVQLKFVQLIQWFLNGIRILFMTLPKLLFFITTMFT